MRHTIAFVCVVALAAVGCGNSLECGKGTVEQDGECVAQTSDNNTTGTNNNTTGTNNNTTGMNNTSNVTCGPGTEEDDMGRCIVSEPVTCGTGTQLDPNSGECVTTDAVCGANTAFDEASGSCLPTDMVCAAGTTFDAAMGICMPDAQCQTGDVVIDGFCASPVEELIANADLREGENNDPNLGGTEEMITLPAEGDQVVVAGAINTPSDLDGDGEDDQDLDFYSFSGTAGQWITVTVQPTAGPNIGFVVEGPNGYRRGVPIGLEYGSARQFVLTRDGEYHVVVLPARVAGELVGDDSYEYAATFSVDTPPEPVAVDLTMEQPAVPGRSLTPVYFSDANNFTADELAIVDAFGPGEVDIVITDGTEITGLSDGSPTALGIVGSTGELRVIIDFIDLFGPEPTNVTARAGGPITDLGTVSAGATVTGTAATLDGEAFFAVDIPAGTLLEITQTNATDEIVDIFAGDEFAQPVASLNSVGGPGGFGPGFYAYGGLGLTGGSVLVQVANNGPAPVMNLELSVTAIEPTDEGMIADGDTLDITEPAAVMRGKRDYFLMTTSAELFMSGTAEAAGADVDFRLIDSMGDTPFRAATGGGETFDWLVPPDTYLAETRAFQELPTGYVLNASFTEFNPVDEVEPNDTLATASPGLTTDDDVRGTIMPGDVDWYSFTVTNSAVYSVVGSLLGNTFFDPLVALTNDAGEELLTAAGPEAQDGLSLFLEPGTYYVSIASNSPDMADYLVSLAEAPSGADLDDAGGNDDAANAQAAVLGASYSIAGVVASSTDEDWYTFDLAAAGTFRVATSASVSFFDDAQNPITVTGGLVDLPMGISYMSVSGFVPGGPGNDYLVSFSVPPTNVETSSPALVIPDGGFPGTVVTDTITVQGGPPCTISSFEVSVDITHPFRSDVFLSLESPTGTTVVLDDATGFDSGDDIVGTYPTDLVPTESLDAFVGEAASGDWILTAGDGFNTDEGTLNTWSIGYNCQ